MSKWIEGKVVGKRQWTERLFSLQVAASAVTFIAGQFARLALPAPPGSKEPMLGRPYSFVNPPNGPPHEFYFNVLPQGPLSPRLAALESEDSVWLLDRANGFFSVSELPDSAALWCLATGTGLGGTPPISRTRTRFRASRPRGRADSPSRPSSAASRTKARSRGGSPMRFVTAVSKRGRACR